MPVPHCMSIGQAAKRLGVSVSLVRRLVRQGVGPTMTRVGGRWMVREDHLLAWLDERARPSESAAA